MSKTLVCVNVLDNVRSEVYGSHSQEWFRLGRNTTDDFILFHPERLSIDNARNQAAKFALEIECDYLYFIDDDMILSPNTYMSLKSCDADVCMALTFLRAYPFYPMFFKAKEFYRSDKNKPIRLDYFHNYKEFIKEDGTLEADALGFACALLKVETLKKVTPPYFVTGSNHTEDVYYCMKLIEQLEDPKIIVDTRVPTGHMMGPEAISAYNRDKMLEFYKPTKKEELEEDRAEGYFERCQQELKKLSSTLDVEKEKSQVMSI